VIKGFRHRGVEKFFLTGSKAGIQPKHAGKLRLQLFALDSARQPRDMNAPGWKLPPLAGELKGHWALSVSGNWRLTFMFEGEDVVLVDYQGYHWFEEKKKGVGHAHAQSTASRAGSPGVSRGPGRIDGSGSPAGHARDSVARAERQSRNFRGNGDPADVGSG
jgi:toxin HigB-1